MDLIDIFEIRLREIKIAIGRALDDVMPLAAVNDLNGTLCIKAVQADNIIALAADYSVRSFAAMHAVKALVLAVDDKGIVSRATGKAVVAAAADYGVIGISTYNLIIAAKGVINFGCPIFGIGSCKINTVITFSKKRRINFRRHTIRIKGHGSLPWHNLPSGNIHTIGGYILGNVRVFRLKNRPADDAAVSVNRPADVEFFNNQIPVFSGYAVSVSICRVIIGIIGKLYGNRVNIGTFRHLEGYLFHIIAVTDNMAILDVSTVGLNGKGILAVNA